MSKVIVIGDYSENGIEAVKKSFGIVTRCWGKTIGLRELMIGCDIGLGESMAGTIIFEKLNNGEVIIIDQQFEQRPEDITDKFKSLELELPKPIQLALPPIKKENNKSHKRDYRFHK